MGKTTMQHIASQQSAGGLLVGGRGSYSLLVWELALCHQEGGLATVGKKYPKSPNTNLHSWIEAERQWLKSRFSRPTNSPNHSAHLPRPIQSRERERETGRQTWRAQDNGSHKIINFESNHTKQYQAKQCNTSLMLLLLLLLLLCNTPNWSCLCTCTCLHSKIDVETGGTSHCEHFLRVGRGSIELQRLTKG